MERFRKIAVQPATEVQSEKADQTKTHRNINPPIAMRPS